MNDIDEILQNYKREKEREKQEGMIGLKNSISDLKKEIAIEKNPYARWRNRK